MSQIILKTQDRTYQSIKVESDAKNAPSTRMPFEWTELAGLSWIFQEHLFDDYA